MSIYIDQATQLRVNIHYQYKGFSRLDTPEIREAAGVIELAEPEPPTDYDPDFYYRVEQDTSPYVVYTRKPEEQIAEIQMQRAKALRAVEVKDITVTTASGKVFDGDEDAQRRMTMAIVALPDDTTLTSWVLADNSVAEVTKVELLEALRLAGTAMAALWIKPYGG